MGNKVKTYEDWEKSEVDLDEFLEPGDEIDEEIYGHIAYATCPPNYDDGKVLQNGECSFERGGIDFYMTAEEKDGKYFYLGELPNKNTPTRIHKVEPLKTKPRKLQVGDPVRVMDPGLIMLQRFAPPNAKPNNEGVILEIWDEHKMYLIEFPIGDDDPKEHSQAAPYPFEMVKLITNEKYGG